MEGRAAALLPTTMLNFLRYKVSADKRRYVEAGYDLDLTYITDRIIAMALPSEGLEKSYRNNVDDVARLLEEKHPGRYMIYNLSERSYDYSKFHNRVHTWCSWPDHHSPPLVLLLQICKSIYLWLNTHPENAVVVHCLAGKGRTGTVIASLLILGGLLQDADKALHFFASRRSLNMWGVTNPSQRRAVQYIEQVIVHGRQPNYKAYRLREVIMHTIPNFDNKGCSPFIELYSTNRGCLLFSGTQKDEYNEFHTPLFYSSEKDQVACFPVDQVIRGDIVLLLKHVTPIYRTEPVVAMCRVQFHTGMLDLDFKGDSTYVCTFTRADFDDAYKDKRFNKDFTLKLVLEEVEASQLTKYDQLDGEWIAEERALLEWQPTGKVDGSICFFDAEEAELEARIQSARETLGLEGVEVAKSGYLIKQGHRVKNWKRRWFVLNNNTLSYFKSPRAVKPNGVITVDNIVVIVQKEDQMTDSAVFSYKISPAHKSDVCCLLRVDDRVWSGCADGTISIWDHKKSLRFSEFQAHTEQTAVLDLIMAGDWVVSAGQDGMVQVWDKNHKHIAKLRGHDKNTKICLLHISSAEPDSKLLLSGDSKGVIMIWDLNTLSCKGSIQLDIAVQHMCLSDSEVWVAVDAFIYTFDYRNWKRKGVSWKAHDKKIHRLLPVDQNIWSCSDDKQICVWSAKTRTRLKTLRWHSEAVCNLTLVGKHVWSSSLDGQTALWSVQAHKFLGEVRGRHDRGMGSVVNVDNGMLWSSSVRVPNHQGKLEGETTIGLWSYVKEMTNCFELITTTESYIIQADTKEERDEWIDAIEAARAKNQAKSNSVQPLGSSWILIGDTPSDPRRRPLFGAQSTPNGNGSGSNPQLGASRQNARRPFLVASLPPSTSALSEPPKLLVQVVALRGLPKGGYLYCTLQLVRDNQKKQPSSLLMQAEMPASRTRTVLRSRSDQTKSSRKWTEHFSFPVFNTESVLKINLWQLLATDKAASLKDDLEGTVEGEAKVTLSSLQQHSGIMEAWLSLPHPDRHKQVGEETSNEKSEVLMSSHPLPSHTPNNAADDTNTIFSAKPSATDANNSNSNSPHVFLRIHLVQPLHIPEDQPQQPVPPFLSPARLISKAHTTVAVPSASPSTEIATLSQSLPSRQLQLPLNQLSCRLFAQQSIHPQLEEAEAVPAQSQSPQPQRKEGKREEQPEQPTTYSTNDEEHPQLTEEATQLPDPAAAPPDVVEEDEEEEEEDGDEEEGDDDADENDNAGDNENADNGIGRDHGDADDSSS